jgi:hypothetical protein
MLQKQKILQNSGNKLPNNFPKLQHGQVSLANVFHQQ